MMVFINKIKTDSPQKQMRSTIKRFSSVKRSNSASIPSAMKSYRRDGSASQLRRILLVGGTQSSHWLISPTALELNQRRAVATTGTKDAASEAAEEREVEEEEETDAAHKSPATDAAADLSPQKLHAMVVQHREALAALARRTAGLQTRTERLESESLGRFSTLNVLRTQLDKLVADRRGTRLLMRQSLLEIQFLSARTMVLGTHVAQLDKDLNTALSPFPTLPKDEESKSVSNLKESDEYKARVDERYQEKVSALLPLISRGGLKARSETNLADKRGRHRESPLSRNSGGGGSLKKMQSSSGVTFGHSREGASIGDGSRFCGANITTGEILTFEKEKRLLGTQKREIIPEGVGADDGEGEGSARGELAEEHRRLFPLLHMADTGNSYNALTNKSIQTHMAAVPLHGHQPQQLSTDVAAVAYSASQEVMRAIEKHKISLKSEERRVVGSMVAAARQSSSSAVYKDAALDRLRKLAGEPLVAGSSRPVEPDTGKNDAREESILPRDANNQQRFAERQNSQIGAKLHLLGDIYRQVQHEDARLLGSIRRRLKKELRREVRCIKRVAATADDLKEKDDGRSNESSSGSTHLEKANMDAKIGKADGDARRKMEKLRRLRLNTLMDRRQRLLEVLEDVLRTALSSSQSSVAAPSSSKQQTSLLGEREIPHIPDEAKTTSVIEEAREASEAKNRVPPKDYNSTVDKGNITKAAAPSDNPRGIDKATAVTFADTDFINSLGSDERVLETISPAFMGVLASNTAPNVKGGSTLLHPHGKLMPAMVARAIQVESEMEVRAELKANRQPVVTPPAPPPEDDTKHLKSEYVGKVIEPKRIETVAGEAKPNPVVENPPLGIVNEREKSMPDLTSDADSVAADNATTIKNIAVPTQPSKYILMVDVPSTVTVNALRIVLTYRMPQPKDDLKKHSKSKPPKKILNFYENELMPTTIVPTNLRPASRSTKKATSDTYSTRSFLLTFATVEEAKSFMRSFDGVELLPPNQGRTGSSSHSNGKSSSQSSESIIARTIDDVDSNKHSVIESFGVRLAWLNKDHS